MLTEPDPPRVPGAGGLRNPVLEKQTGSWGNSLLLRMPHWRPLGRIQAVLWFH